MSKPLNENVINVINWANDRNIYHPTDGGTMTSQLFKLVEEVGEAVSGIVKGKKEEAKDGIGDTKVCLINLMEIAGRNGMDVYDNLNEKEKSLLNLFSAIGWLADSIIHGDEDNNLSGISDTIDWELGKLAESEGFTYDECLDQAYNEIKDRKGTMVNRCFVKESDLVQKVENAGVYGTQTLLPEEKSEKLKQFAVTIGFDGLFDDAKQVIENLESHRRISMEVINYIDDKFNEYLLLPYDDAKENFIEEVRLKSFNEWFFENYENGREIKEGYEAEMQKHQTLTYRLTEIIQSLEGNEDEILKNEEFQSINDEIEAIDKKVKEEYIDTIIESSEKYSKYKNDKINDSINNA